MDAVPRPQQRSGSAPSGVATDLPATEPGFAPKPVPAQVERFGPDQPRAPRLVVAIPVRNEEERIALCLDALASQEDVDQGELLVVLLVNNTTDGTADQVRALAPHARFATEMHRVELDLARANAGWARRLAMDAAAERVAPDGVILTTDADTLANPDWIAANLREIAAGADAVAGYVMADPVELMRLDQQVLDRGHLEWQYQQLAAELVARIDQEAHDPWPRHNQNCGASAAITLDAYRRIGGLPPRPVGEDRALFEMVRRLDGRVRHSLQVQVVTSARTEGRACGGLADEIRLRTDPDHPCDEALEVAVATLRRALWRCELRQAWNAGRLDAGEWARRLRVPLFEVRQAASRPHFGQVWAEIEGRSPRLRRVLVTGNGLKRELRRMRKLVASVRSWDAHDSAPARLRGPRAAVA